MFKTKIKSAQKVRVQFKWWEMHAFQHHPSQCNTIQVLLYTVRVIAYTLRARMFSILDSKKPFTFWIIVKPIGIIWNVLVVAYSTLEILICKSYWRQGGFRSVASEFTAITVQVSPDAPSPKSELTRTPWSGSVLFSKNPRSKIIWSKERDSRNGKKWVLIFFCRSLLPLQFLEVYYTHFMLLSFNAAVLHGTLLRVYSIFESIRPSFDCMLLFSDAVCEIVFVFL